MSEIIGWFTAIQSTITDHAGAWWTYVVLGLLCWIDGFFPPLPSESIVIAMSALATHGGPVNIWIVVVVSVVGAFLGDNTAYWIGRLIPLERIFRGERGHAMVEKARHMVHRRGALVLLTARFIPVYRMAVNMAAGALRFPYRRFVLIDIVSALMWMTYSVLIGLASGAVFKSSPLVGVVVGVLFGIAVGFIVDAVSRFLHMHKAARESQQPSTEK